MMGSPIFKNVFLQSKVPEGLSDQALQAAILESQGPLAGLKKVLIIPPDTTRLHAYAGVLAKLLLSLLPPTCEVDILPALGTHQAMSAADLDLAFPGIPHQLFRIHDWRKDVQKIGEVPAAFLDGLSGGKIKQSVPVEVNRLLLDPSYERIFSIGQVIPHEVAGMANYNKNLLIGCGGPAMINASHLLGALCGMESMMGRDHTPVHQLFDYAESHFLEDARIQYLLTVTTISPAGKVQVQGLGIGRGRALFSQAVKLSQEKNITLLEKPVKKAVVYLRPDEFKSTWLGNKAIYRTRLMMADGGQLIIIAPGIDKFGEDPTIDALIRKYGYLGTELTLRALGENADLQANQSAAAHLIHGSSEGRFEVVYAPGGLDADEIKAVGFTHLGLESALLQYPIQSFTPGFNQLHGEEIYYIQNPALGLWALQSSFAK
jgi:nickel-dependent lactate racemase